jgi:hypothetical protein
VREWAGIRKNLYPTSPETDTFCVEGQPFTQGWAKHALQQYIDDDNNISLYQFLLSCTWYRESIEKSAKI